METQQMIIIYLLKISFQNNIPLLIFTILMSLLTKSYPKNKTSFSDAKFHREKKNVYLNLPNTH